MSPAETGGHRGGVATGQREPWACIWVTAVLQQDSQPFQEEAFEMSDNRQPHPTHSKARKCRLLGTVQATRLKSLRTVPI